MEHDYKLPRTVKSERKRILKEKLIKKSLTTEMRARFLVEQYFVERNYYILEESQRNGPIDLSAYKIIGGKIIWFNIDVKGISVDVNYTPQFKRRLSKKFYERNKLLRVIQAIVYKGEIRFKDWDNRERKIPDYSFIDI